MNSRTRIYLDKRNHQIQGCRCHRIFFASLNSALLLLPAFLQISPKQLTFYMLPLPLERDKPIFLKITRWQSRRACAHLLLQELQNCNSLLNNHRQENIGSHQGKIPHVQEQRRSPNKVVGQVKSHLESNPICTRDA